MTITGLPNYTIYAMNIADDLRVQTLGGKDHVQVNSVTGPTLIDTGTDDDVIDVSAETAGEPSVVLFDGPIPPDYVAEVVVEAGTGRNQLNIEETGNTNPDSFTITDNEISSFLLPDIQYRATGGKFSRVEVTGTAHGDVYQVLSTSSNVD